MSIFIRKKEEQSPWMTLTDLMVGLFTLFVFAFLAVAIKKNHFEKEFVLKNEAFTRKEKEYTACIDEKKDTEKKLMDYQAVLDKELKGVVQEGLLAVTDGKIDIQHSLLFPTAQASVTAAGSDLLSTVAKAMRGVMKADTTFMIMVAGYTDDIPIHSVLYKSNWELSSARATNVVRTMIGAGFPADRIFASGFGEYKPKVPNTSEKNRSENRRVEIVRVPVSQNRFAFMEK